MNTKLTLRLDDELIARAKAHAAKSGRSVSQLVAEYFSLIDEQPQPEAVSPGVRSLRGRLRGSSVEEPEYRRHLAEKHR